jgi:hypothetical protein
MFSISSPNSTSSGTVAPVLVPVRFSRFVKLCEWRVELASAE